MDFWCHASALLALSWAHSLRPLIKWCACSCSWRAAAAAVRTAGSAQWFHRAHRETLASSICVSICVVTRVLLVHRLLESAR